MTVAEFMGRPARAVPRFASSEGFANEASAQVSLRCAAPMGTYPTLQGLRSCGAILLL